MAVFAVHLSSEDPVSQAASLAGIYPGDQHYRVSDRFYLIRADTTSHTVAAVLGLREGASGAVFKLNDSYFGWESRAMWEWLDTARNAPPF